MSTLAIIGTAGRQDDKNRLFPGAFGIMYQDALGTVRRLGVTCVRSGGAAWADHLAVRLFLNDHVPALDLCLPAAFEGGKFVGADRSDGGIANYYHGMFSTKLGIRSLKEIQDAIDKGATAKSYNGFFARNAVVGNSDWMLAYTFGTHSGRYGREDPGYRDPLQAGLKDGGTAHTWRGATTPQGKKHVDLHELLGGA